MAGFQVAAEDQQAAFEGVHGKHVAFDTGS
jgi:hypothetical protein